MASRRKPRRSPRQLTAATPSRELTRTSLHGIHELAAQLRAAHWRDTPELPDRVLRAIASRAPNTRLSIRANYRVFKRWCAAQSPPVAPYPAAPATIARFLQDNSPPIRVARSGEFELDTDAKASPAGTDIKTYATLARYLATLGQLHLDGGHANPAKDTEVTAVWRVLRRGLARARQKSALTLPAIQIAAQDLPNTLIGKRDRALLYLAYALMARRSELVALNVANLQRDPDGSATVTFERLKTGETSTNYLPPALLAVLDDWLRAAKITDGALFRRLDFAARGAERPAAAVAGERLSSQSVALIFKRIARRLNRPDLLPTNVSSHSARIGATHDLLEDGASDASIMRDAGWKTTRMVGLYGRGARAKQGAMASRLKQLLRS